MAKKAKKKKATKAAIVTAPTSTPNETAGFVSTNEFNEFKEQTNKNTIDILDAIKSLGDKPAQVIPGPTAEAPSRAFSITNKPEEERPQTTDQASAKNSNYTLNPAHQSIFEEYFDPADGFEARMEYPYFTIIVPLKFSNADPAWKKHYKTDTRLKFLKYDNIEGGMRDWCRLVAGNLKYDRNKKMK